MNKLNIELVQNVSKSLDTDAEEIDFLLDNGLDVTIYDHEGKSVRSVSKKWLQK